MTVEIDESERQAILLAIAHLAVARPGWDFMLGEIADKLNPPPGGTPLALNRGGSIMLPDTLVSGREMYENFKATVVAP